MRYLQTCLNNVVQRSLQLVRSIAHTVGERCNRRYSRVGDGPFFDPADFPWVSRLESNWEAVRKELEVILERRQEVPNFQDVSPNQRKITNDDKWKTFILYVYGHEVKHNGKQCPETVSLSRSIPGMKTLFFSIIAPHKHIPVHRGPYNGVLRYHLGLVIPREQEKCRIRVGDEIAHWGEGKSLIFDDAYPHEVWNETDEERVILFVDFLRPLPFPVALLNRFVVRLIRLSPLVTHLVRNLDERNKHATG